MGKRVNLAELAREEVPDSYSPAPSRRTPPSERGGDGERTVELDGATLQVAEIATNPLNSRDPADDSGEEFEQLVATIAQHGVLQPIVVCSAGAFIRRYPDEQVKLGAAKWVALIGNRRLRASVSAGVERVPALINDDRLSSMYEVMLVENSHRKDLNLLHEAEAMRTVLTADGISQRELAVRIGRTPMYVSQRLALLGLIAPLRGALGDGSLKVEQARQIGSLEPQEQQTIAEAGPPYRLPTGSAVGKAERGASRPRRIAASSPAQAAESIRKLFTAAELAELIRLLGEQDD